VAAFRLCTKGETVAEIPVQPTPEHLARALAILGQLAAGDQDQCRYDHDGDCQEHAWFGTEWNCPFDAARKLLTEMHLL
jgi:hypothetical protein